MVDRGLDQWVLVDIQSFLVCCDTWWWLIVGLVVCCESYDVWRCCGGGLVGLVFFYVNGGEW